MQVEIVDVTKSYLIGELNIKAVDSVSLKIEKGQFLSIVGHSGSGKTTLLSIIGGITRPTSGKVLYEGRDIYSLTDEDLSEYRNKKIGFMFQFASLLPMLTSKENVLLPSLFSPSKGLNNEKKAEEYLDIVGVGDKKDAYPAQLSGGQQRRVAIARALINEPEVILADEPTGDLDEETEADVMNLFKRMNEEMGITFILVTHSTELAREAKRRLRMHHGKVMEI